TARRLGDRPAIVDALCSLGYLDAGENDLPMARARGEERRSIRTEEVLAAYGPCARGRELAVAGGEQGAALWRVRAGKRVFAPGMTFRVGPMARARGEESLALCREMKDKIGMASSLHLLGVVAEYEEDYALAGAFYAESLQAVCEIHKRDHLPSEAT